MKALIQQEIVEPKIFLIKGHKVLLSSHLAELYAVETRVLIQAGKRNIERFPKDFMFSLTRKEIRNISQIVISSKLKHSPNIYAFTEQGLAMLSGILNSKRAVQVNIAIMRAFVKLRQILSTHKELVYKLNELERKTERHDSEIKTIFNAIRQLMASPDEKPKRKIGFYRDNLIQEK
ncbi:MAG: ORF6N domain-containing protein [Planctomycetota bacterium]